MQKIATPQDLQAELHRLLAYCQEENPSREKLAAEIRELADRVGGRTVEAWATAPFEMNLRGLKLNPATFKGLKALDRDLDAGRASKSDIKNVIEDLEFEESRANARSVKKIQALITFLKKHT